jgi:hypothetical protein
VTLQPGQKATVRQSITGSINDRPILKAGKYQVLASINEINNMHEHIIGFEEFCHKNNLQPWTGKIKSSPSTFIVLPKSDSIWGEALENKKDARQEQSGTVTQEPSSDTLANRVYDISDLVYVGARISGGTVNSMTGGDRDTMGRMRGQRINIPEQKIVNEAQKIVNLIIRTIDPNSWYVNNPDEKGTIFPFPAERPRKLAIYQTPAIHQQIENFLESRRKQIDKTQISIEMRYLYTNVEYIDELRDSMDIEFTSDTFMDDKQVETLLRTSHKIKDVKSMTAPMVTILDNEPAQLSIVKEFYYVSGYNEPNDPSENPKPIIGNEKIGTFCELTPQITPDQKNIYLEFKLENIHIAGFEERTFQGKYIEQVPQFETKTISTGKLIPYDKTLFFDGGPITICEKKETTSAETTTDSFELTKEKKRLIILIKPTILTQQQTEQTHQVKPIPIPIDPNDGFKERLEARLSR